jgi:tetratricopeptide (TPR) repeat protein
VHVSVGKRVTSVGAVCLALAILHAPSLAVAQGGSVIRRVPPTAPSPPRDAPAELPVFEATPDPELERTKAQVESLRQLVQSTLVPTSTLLAVLVGGLLLLGAGSGLAAVALVVWRGRRAPPAAPAVPAGQAELLEATHRVVGLAHEMLGVVRDATARTAQAERATLAERAATLAARARGALTPDPRLLADDPRRRREIAAVARAVEAEEAGFRLHGVELPDACLVAVGVARWLAHDPEAALEPLQAATRRQPDAEVTAVAHAALGTALAELGRFARAADAFRQALASLPPRTPVHAELLRRRLECAFFDTPTDGAAAAADDLDRQLSALEAESADGNGRATDLCERIAATRGDVLTWAARHTSRDAAGNLLDRAVACYRRAGSGPWARSGFLQVREGRGEPTDAEAYRALADQAVEAIGNAGHPAALAQLHAIRVVALARLGAPRAEVDATYREVHIALREVDPGAVLDAPVERRAVDRDAFTAELRAIHRGHVEPAAAIVAAAAPTVSPAPAVSPAPTVSPAPAVSPAAAVPAPTGDTNGSGADAVVPPTEPLPRFAKSGAKATRGSRRGLSA